MELWWDCGTDGGIDGGIGGGIDDGIGGGVDGVMGNRLWGGSWNAPTRPLDHSVSQSPLTRSLMLPLVPLTPPPHEYADGVQLH